MSFFYVINGKRHGPVTFDELKNLAVKAQLKRQDRVWHQGEKDWEPAGSVTGLFDELPPELEPGDASADPTSLGSGQAASNIKSDASESILGKWKGKELPVRQILAGIGILICLAVLFPPICTYQPAIVLDPGYAGGGRNPNYADVNPMGYGKPDVVLDEGGYRDKRFAFILSLAENDKIVMPQLLAEVVGITLIGLVILAIRRGRFPNPERTPEPLT